MKRSKLERRVDALALVNATANAGIGFSPVTLTFKTRHFKFQNTIITRSKVQLRVINQPRPNGSFWDYDVHDIPGKNIYFLNMGGNEGGSQPGHTKHADTGTHT